MNVRIVNKGNYSLTKKEEQLLSIVNDYRFELKTGEIIRFQDVIDNLRLKLVLDGSAKRVKLINPSCLKLSEIPIVAGNDVVQIKKEARSVGEDEIQSHGENSKKDELIGQWYKIKEQLESRVQYSEDERNSINASIKALIDKLRPIVLVDDCILDSYLLKGLFNSSDKSVTLYMDNMKMYNESDNYHLDVVFVYIHEMFHAYYCLCRGKRGQYVREIEECMAEFGMLSFLESLKDGNKDFSDVFNGAKEEVERKRFTIGDLAAYGFGKYVYDHCNCKKDWISAYSQRSGEFEKKMSDVCKYVDGVYPFYPINEYGCYKLLAHILFDVDKHKNRFNHFDAFHSVALRILLIDDKVGTQCEKDDMECGRNRNVIMGMESDSDNLLTVKKCPAVDCSKKQCKLCTIKRLMDDGSMPDGKGRLFYGIGTAKEYFYWQEKDVECFYCPTFTPDFIDDITKLNGFHQINLDSDIEETKDKDEVLSIKCDFEPKPNGKVQIVGVRDVRTALLLMSKFKFDMVFCDYLLDYKSKDNTGPRDYANQFFDFLSHDYKEEIKLANDSDKEQLRILDRLRRNVLDNRGPIDKLWIMPITGFNQTFIQDLYRNQIDLIGHKWNISNGADPITTPWQFLYHLNKFIELQLKSCVYRMDHLLRFVKYTCEDLQDLKDKKGKNNGNEKKLGFFEFQSFMGSEYANYMRRYGNRHLIQRDAVCEKDGNTENKSVFATYVWDAFYVNPEYRDVIELNRLIQRFLYQASTMHNDRNGRQRLEETFGQLCLFIDTNLKVRANIEEQEDLEENKLEEKLDQLRILMDELTKSKRDDDNK